MKKYFAKEDGQGIVEYGLIISLVAIVSIASLGIFASGVMDKYDVFAEALSIEQMDDGSYVITTEDGVYIVSTLGRLQGPYTGDEKDIKIPNSLNGYALKEIYQKVFMGKGLTDVVFDTGSGLIQIHAQAFRDNELSKISLPDGLQRIDASAFRDNNLTEITLPASVKRIEWNAFDGNEINKITIGANVTYIGTQAFKNNSAKFNAAYNAANGGAGTYVYVNGNWVKQ
jgi:Flp pilus assembly pilin Flp